MPGAFPATGAASRSGSGREGPYTPRRGPAGGLSRRGSPRAAGGRLPPLWGVDLALLLITLGGIALLIAHLQAVLLALAGFILLVLRFLFWALVLAVLAVAAVLRLCSRRRGWW